MIEAAVVDASVALKWVIGASWRGRRGAVGRHAPQRA